MQRRDKLDTGMAFLPCESADELTGGRIGRRPKDQRFRFQRLRPDNLYIKREPKLLAVREAVAHLLYWMCRLWVMLSVTMRVI